MQHCVLNPKVKELLRTSGLTRSRLCAIGYSLFIGCCEHGDEILRSIEGVELDLPRETVGYSSRCG